MIFSSDHSGMKLEISYKKNTGKFANMWRLDNMLLNNQWVKKIKGDIKKNIDTNENGIKTHQNLRDAAKTALRGNFRIINAYIKKQ